VIDINESRKRAEAAMGRANAATPGPWYDSVMDGGYSAVISPDHWTERSIADVWEEQANADFIAEAREDVPQLAHDLLQALEEIERLNAYIEERDQDAIQAGWDRRKATYGG